MAIYEDEYLYFVDDFLKEPQKPYTMHNNELAQAFWEELQKDSRFSKASYHEYDITQYFCFGDPARAALLKLLKKQQKRQEEELQATIRLIEDLRKGGNMSLYQYLIEVENLTEDEALETELRLEIGLEIPETIREMIKRFYEQELKI